MWVFDGTKLNQTPANGRRFATGMRNAVAIEWNAKQNALFSVIHGRDSLDTLFPALYNAEDNATRQAEEFHQIVDGGDYGWPYTFFDTKLGKRVLAPEYGGDAKKEPEAGKYPDPLVAYPAHWAPNDLLFYSGKNFPAKYRDGAFIAFHGSWNRAPEPQAGYKVVFQPMKDGKPSGALRSVRRWIRGRDEGQQSAQCAIPPGRSRGGAGWLAVRCPIRRRAASGASRTAENEGASTAPGGGVRGACARGVRAAGPRDAEPAPGQRLYAQALPELPPGRWRWRA